MLAVWRQLSIRNSHRLWVDLVLFVAWSGGSRSFWVEMDRELWQVAFRASPYHNWNGCITHSILVQWAWQKNTVMTLRRMVAGMRESGANPEHLTGAVSAAGRHSGRKSVIEGDSERTSERTLEKANGRRVFPTVRARRPMIGPYGAHNHVRHTACAKYRT